MVEGGGVRVEFNEESCVYTVANVSKRKWENQSHKNKETQCFLCNCACLSTEQIRIPIEITAN